ncbi:MAG: DNA cytosine methyltransferase [Ruthenibacterium sp.]
MSAQTSLLDEITVDGFCGGGGWSTGFELATRRSVDIGINHDAAAIALHKKNHPYTKHYNENIWQVDPREACAGRAVGWAHFSPDCKHFSRAKGSKPVEKKIRGLAWVIVKWAGCVLPRIISMENVPEFMTWGPLIAARGTHGRVLRKDGTEAEKGERTPHCDQQLIPDKRRRGKTFRRFVKELRALGYAVEWCEMRACDYGAPTTRKRFFLIARRDKKPIVWPEPTHADPQSAKVKSGKLLPWRTAAEVIDWTQECPSIFTRKKPLAENTLRRIARGIQNFVTENPEPFLVQVNHSGEQFRGQSIADTMPTITAKNGFAVVSPMLIQYHTEQSSAEHRGQGVDVPLQTVDASNRYGIAAATLVQTEQKNAAVTAFLSKYYGGNYEGAGSAVDAPVDTITAVDHNSLCTAHIVRLNKHCVGQSVREPLGTITAGGGHYAQVQSLLIKYYGGGTSHSLNEPLHTITTKDCFGLVTVRGVDYRIIDIGLRMLSPRELYNAQGFPGDYEIETDCYGKAYPKKEQVARCGNAVPPPFASAIARANAPEWCGTKQITTMEEWNDAVTA